MPFKTDPTVIDPKATNAYQASMQRERQVREGGFENTADFGTWKSKIWLFFATKKKKQV